MTFQAKVADMPDGNVAGAGASTTSAGDPLTDSLLFLAAHHGRALTRDALLSGLPILDGRLKIGRAHV